MRKWLVGRGIKRAGLVAPRAAVHERPVGAPGEEAVPHFLPIDLAAARASDRATEDRTVPAPERIRIELRRGATQLAIDWPASHVQACAQ